MLESVVARGLESPPHGGLLDVQVVGHHVLRRVRGLALGLPFCFVLVRGGDSGRKGSFRHDEGVCAHQSQDLRFISADLDRSSSSDLARRPSSGSSRGSLCASASSKDLRLPVRSTDHLNSAGGGELGTWSQPGSNDPMALTRARIDDAGVHVRVALVVKAMSTRQEKVVGAKNQGNSLSSMFMNPLPQ